MLKGIYLASCTARHKNYNLVYQDIEKDKYNCDIGGDMLDIDLSPYDYIIASPPCNYYSRANYRRDISEYSLKTKHLLPSILEKLGKLNKPFIVENVRNNYLFTVNDIYDIANKYNIWVYYVGRHTYFTNIFFNPICNQKIDYIDSLSKSNTLRQGGINVFNVIERFLYYIHLN